MSLRLRWQHVVAGAVATGAIASLAVWVWPRQEAPGGSTPLHVHNSWWHAEPAYDRVDLPSAPAAAQQTRDRLYLGSFAGTVPAGEWCVGEDRRLNPCHGLRDRFEYYLLGIGEVTVDQLRALVQDEARQANGDLIASQIMRVWDGYWQLRTYHWRTQFSEHDRSTWMPLLAEQRLVRRDILGPAWAEAFYAEEESGFEALQAHVESGKPLPPDSGAPVPQMLPGVDAAQVTAERVARYGVAAAQRLAAVDSQWADWQRRLDAARQESIRLRRATNLSDVLRAQELNRYIAANFGPEEAIRVRALLAD